MTQAIYANCIRGGKGNNIYRILNMYYERFVRDLVVTRGQKMKQSTSGFYAMTGSKPPNFEL